MTINSKRFWLFCEQNPTLAKRQDASGLSRACCGWLVLAPPGATSRKDVESGTPFTQDSITGVAWESGKECFSSSSQNPIESILSWTQLSFVLTPVQPEGSKPWAGVEVDTAGKKNARK